MPFRSRVRAHLSVALIPVLALAVACDEPVPENNSCDGDWFSQFLADEGASTSDLSCVGDALSADPIYDAACQVSAALAGTTVDHQSRDLLPSVAVTAHHADDLSAAADWSATSDDTGAIAEDVPMCTPLAYTTDRGNDDARITNGQHVVLSPGDDGTFDFAFRSVSNGTLSLVNLILGTELDDANGFIFGKAVGCDGEAAVEKVQILVRDESCTVPSTFQSGYTENEVPSGFSRSTTADGFFFAINIPPGAWTIEAYVADGNSFRIVGATPIVVRSGEVTLADLQVGRSDGLRVKADCTGC